MQNLSLIINAGGHSQRMGSPKALLPLPPDGRPLITHIARRLRPFVTQQTIVIANDSQIESMAGMDDETVWLADDYPGLGPLSGIATGLAACTGWAICVACDMPLLNPALFAHFCMLAAEQDEAGNDRWDAVVPLVNAYPEPLHALYHHRCLTAIRQRIVDRQLRATSFLPDVRVRYVYEAELRRLDPELHSFFNANTPADWHTLSMHYTRMQL